MTDMDDTASRLLLPLDLWHVMQAHAQACLPEEACGLLGGPPIAAGKARVTRVLPVENALHSPVRFRMHPRAQLAAFQALEEAGLELLAIFHSHPRGPRQPSATDLNEFFYPGVLTLIMFPAQPGATSTWDASAFHIQGALLPGEQAAAFSEVPLLFDPAD